RPGGVVQHAGGPWLRPAAGVSAGWPGPRAGCMYSYVDLAVSYNMLVDHGFAQPLEFLLGGLDRVPGVC
ncbi:hypothetical protein EVG19_28295, partial [Klebsiella pneumoniae]